jgi:putative transposase
MNKYNPNKHHRKSIRLKGYDYSQSGLYFITICVQDRACLFGEISGRTDLNVSPEMMLNVAGLMVEKWYHELENKFPDMKCHQHVVMPNHFHFIIENVGNVGADRRVCPDKTTIEPSVSGEIMGETIMGETIMGETIMGETIMGETIMGETIMGEHAGSPLSRVVQWFKTMTTNEYIRGVKQYGWATFNGKLWQRNYWEHIIRDEQSYNRISEYIINNPQNYRNDKLNGK